MAMEARNGKATPAITVAMDAMEAMEEIVATTV
jgi:hypothetical protein